MTEFDIAIIGGGPGGYVAAIRAAQNGACVCLIEDDRVGGTCLNRGCIPTKAFYSTALLLNRIRQADQHGIGVQNLTFDFTAAAQRKDQVVDQLVGGIEQLLKGYKIDIFRGRGKLEGPNKVKIRRPDVVGHIKAKNIILATGSKPAVPKSITVDGKNILTSDEILAIKELPSRLLIVGGGYIGCEFASIFAAFGTEVILVEQLPGLLSRTDRQAVKEVEKGLKEQGVRIYTETSAETLEPTESGVHFRLSNGEEGTVDKALIAVGRTPRSSDLGLEEAGVELVKGAVKVNERMRTSVENIFAIGDLTNIIPLAHVASYQANIAVTNALGGDVAADYRVVPSTIFTLPEIGQVGLNEEDCRNQELATEIGRFTYRATSKALCDGETRGMIKLVAAKEDGRLLGGTIVGEEASALIAEVAVAIHQEMTAEDLGKVIHSHPTLPEMIREAAEDTRGLAVHKAGRRRD